MQKRYKKTNNRASKTKMFRCTTVKENINK